MPDRHVLPWAAPHPCYFRSYLLQDVVLQDGGVPDHATITTIFRACCDMAVEGRISRAMTRRMWVAVLKACGRMGAVEQGHVVHAQLMKHGFHEDAFVCNAVIDMYGKCGSLEDARRVFYGLHNRDVVSYNVMLSVYTRHRRAVDALQLFPLMLQQGIVPDNFTIVGLLKACSRMGALDHGRLLHAYLMMLGPVQELDAVVASSLVGMYARCSCLDDARSVFDNARLKDVVSYTQMIAAYVQHGKFDEAHGLFARLQQDGIKADHVMLLTMLKACSSSAHLGRGRAIHAVIVESGLHMDVVIGSKLVDMYAKCDSPADAHSVFDRMQTKDSVSWNTLIAAYSQHGHAQQALQLFYQMQLQGMHPDKATLVSILKACSSLAALDEGKVIHNHIVRTGHDSDPFLCSSLIDMYTKCGSLADARRVFDRMAKRDVVSYGAMMTGYAQHGHSDQALQLFMELLHRGIQPDNVTFVSLLSACSRAGFLGHAKAYFHSMWQDHGIPQEMEHYACMVDVLCRAGHLYEALELIHHMPFSPAIVVWMSMLGASRVHTNVELGMLSFHSISKLDPAYAPAYVAMSNIYAAAGMWEQEAEIRRKMHMAGIKKEPGRTWMQLHNQVHTFFVEDKHHPERKDIYAMLDSLVPTLDSSS